MLNGARPNGWPGGRRKQSQIKDEKPATINHPSLFFMQATGLPFLILLT